MTLHVVLYRTFSQPWLQEQMFLEWKAVCIVSRCQHFGGTCWFSVEITNKMQSCIRIYYSTFHWRLNMFLVAYRSSSGALTVFAASGLHTHVVTGRSQVWVGLRPVTTCVCKPEAADKLELLMMSGMPLETCWAFNERWNNKFHYKVASCWLFLLSHTTMHGSMNIKPITFLKQVGLLTSSL